jgi:hypothetical protein
MYFELLLGRPSLQIYLVVLAVVTFLLALQLVQLVLEVFYVV